jgi:hypothetical protein
MDPEVEARLAPMLAMAAQRLLQMNQAQAQQQQAQQQAQDPMVQMQQAELQIKQQDLQRKAQKDKSDAQLKAAQIDIEKARVENQSKAEGVRIGLKAEQDRKNSEAKQTLEAIRLGSDAQARQNDLTERMASNMSGIRKGK